MRGNDEARNVNVGAALPPQIYFVIGISGFLLHSAFGIRHFQ